jgi:hypothetical protein
VFVQNALRTPGTLRMSNSPSTILTVQHYLASEHRRVAGCAAQLHHTCGVVKDVYSHVFRLPVQLHIIKNYIH